ncbi:MAG: dihydroxyacetone kinase subunit L [Sphaerochaetaceae bacterium]
MEKITIGDWPVIMESVASVMDGNAEMLCALDAKMGDGDLGLTMKKGYDALSGLFKGIVESDMGKHLYKVGVKFAALVPSTMGTLMASGWMEGGKRLVGVVSVGSNEFASFLAGFAEGVAKRGKCQIGERTLLDALSPAARRAQECAQKGCELGEVAFSALQGSLSGVEETKNMIPKYGKAAVFSAKAIGIPDQGATAGMLLIQGLYEGIKNHG